MQKTVIKQLCKKQWFSNYTKNSDQATMQKTMIKLLCKTLWLSYYAENKQ